MSRLITSVMTLWLFSAQAAMAGIAQSLTEWQVDYEKSSIEFTATVNDAPSKGRFSEFDADIGFHPEILDESMAFIEISTDALDTDYPEVAANLIEKVWFNAREHPTAVFEVMDFSKTSSGHYIANGSLTLKGTTNPVSLTFTFTPQQDGSAIAEGYTTIKRSDFNVGEGDWAETSIVRNEVILHIIIHATPLE